MSGESFPDSNQNEEQTMGVAPMIMRNLGDAANFGTLANNGGNDEGSTPGDKAPGPALAPDGSPATPHDMSEEEVNDYYEERYNDARLNNNLPEGVRDIQDYREFLAERDARVDEQVGWRKTAIENVDRIDDDYDRDLATTLLPLFGFIRNPSNFTKYDDYKRQHSVFDSITTFLNSDHEDTTLSSFLKDKARETYEQYEQHGLLADRLLSEEYLNFSYTLDGKPIEFGNRIARALEEDRDEFEVRYYKPGKSGEGASETKESTYSFEGIRMPMVDDKYNVNRVVARDIAREIGENAKEDDSDIIKERNLWQLQDIDSLNTTPTLEELDGEISRSISKLAEAVHNASGEGNINSATITVADACGVVWTSDLKREIENRVDDYDEYRHLLRRGKDILEDEGY